MCTNKKSIRLSKAIVAMSASGMMIATSCASTELEAIVIGIDAATRHLANEQKADDISFGDWLLAELKDL